MGDYLKSQCLWHITSGAPGSTRPVEATANAPTLAEAVAQAAWDENSEKVQGIIGSRISQMLRPHIGTTCTETWTNLGTRFGTPDISEIAADMYTAYSMKLLATHNPHPDMERMNMLFECLRMNSMTFSDVQQGLILLNMILREWLTVAQIYSQANQTLVTTTFLGVRETIMAKYEHTTHPSTLAVHRISAVQCKGKSPIYTEQTSSKSAPPKASGDVPSGTPKKKTQRGGKGKNVKVHTIVSSALVPQSVTKCLQETHHAVAPVAAPISVPVMASTVVGGPSRAPVQVPMTIALFQPSGVTYTKTEAPKNAQAFSGFMSQEGPHTIRKPPVAWKGAAPLKLPVSLEARMACSTIIKNAVASLSRQTLDPPPAPLLECIATPTPANYAEHAAHEKAKRKRTCQGKKAKKDLVHMAPLDPFLKGKNIMVFGDAEIPRDEIVSNPIAESGETLFIPDPQDCYNHDNIK